MEQLPYIDEHSQRVDARADVIWTALLKVLRREMGRQCADRADPGLRPRAGYGRVRGPARGKRCRASAWSRPTTGRRLTLRGRHRFSNYALTFVPDGDRLRAQTHAAFPGVLGRLFRAAVIGSGGHRLVTRRLLRQVARAT